MNTFAAHAENVAAGAAAGAAPCSVVRCQRVNQSFQVWIARDQHTKAAQATTKGPATHTYQSTFMTRGKYGEFVLGWNLLRVQRKKPQRAWAATGISARSTEHQQVVTNREFVFVAALTMAASHRGQTSNRNGDLPAKTTVQDEKDFADRSPETTEAKQTKPDRLSTMASSEAAAGTLKEWARNGSLSKAVLSQDGTSLTLDGTTLDGTQKIVVQHGGKTCEYSLASIFLQIDDPNQKLLQYRGRCKAHNVADLIRVSDKKTVVSFFLGETDQTTTEAASAPKPVAPAAATDAAVAGDDAAAAARPSSAAKPPPPPSRKERDDKHRHGSSSSSRRSSEESARRKERHDKKKRKHEKEKRSSSSSGKDRHHSSSSSSSKRHKKDKRGSSPAAPPPKKKKPAITTENLLSNLNVVVNKRLDDKTDKDKTSGQEEDWDTKKKEGISDDAAHQKALEQALSADGFEITPELVKESNVKEIVSLEIPVGNSASILRPAPGRNFQRVLDLFMEMMEPASKKHRSGSSRHAHGKKPAVQGKPWLKGKTPVIVLPKGMTSALTLMNAHEFLGNSKFVPRDVMLKQKPTAKHKVETKIKHRLDPRRGAVELEFELMDNPRVKLGHDPKEWDRIVGVIVLGASWQFKDWPRGYNNPVDLFSRSFGFFVGMEGAKLPAELSKWAVQQGKLSRDKRGLDSVCFAKFWDGLEERMVTKKPEFLPEME